MNKYASRSIFLITNCFVLLLSLAIQNVQAKNFLSNTGGGTSAAGQNALGFGYFNAPVVYRYQDASKDRYLSNYGGWLVKAVHYVSPTSAFQIHYLQAYGEESIRELSGSALYGFNLNRPGIGAYVGVSYTLKQRVQFAGEQRVSNEKEYGWDFPVGIQLKNGLFTFNFETRYKYFLLQGDNIEADAVRYPLFFSVLLNF